MGAAITIFEGPKAALPCGAQLDPNGTSSVAASVIRGMATLAYPRHCMGGTKLGDILETLPKTCWFADIRISYELSELPPCPSTSLSQL